jgi:GNAT superfamily N-acetyltransferase
MNSNWQPQNVIIFFMSITISQFTQKDLEGAKNVVLKGLKDFGFSYHEEYDYDLNDPQKYYIDKGGIFYVVKEHKKIVGTVAVINKGDHVAELKRMYVNKEYQGKGLGTGLLGKAVEFCKQNKFTKVEFETNKLFTAAHRFYQKHGFKIAKEDSRSYYMEKDL